MLRAPGQYYVLFELYQYNAFDDHVSTKFSDAMAAKEDGDCQLDIRFDPDFLKRNLHRALIYTFQKAWAEVVVHVVERTDDLFSELRVFKRDFCAGVHS